MGHGHSAGLCRRLFAKWGASRSWSRPAGASDGHPSLQSFLSTATSFADVRIRRAALDHPLIHGDKLPYDVRDVVPVARRDRFRPWRYCVGHADVNSSPNSWPPQKERPDIDIWAANHRPRSTWVAGAAQAVASTITPIVSRISLRAFFQGFCHRNACSFLHSAIKPAAAAGVAPAAANS